MLQIYRRIPILKCDFREHTCQSAISIKLQSKFIEITLRHGCSPVNLLHIFRTSFDRNTSGRLLLYWLSKINCNIIRMLKRGCLHVKFRPGMKSSLSMVKCLLLFTRFCRDEISSRDEKIKKRRVNTSSWDEILKWACFFSFWRMYSNMFYKFNMFEHNESMNIMKHMASL